jgi:hypothetical protein
LLGGCHPFPRVVGSNNAKSMPPGFPLSTNVNTPPAAFRAGMSSVREDSSSPMPSGPSPLAPPDRLDLPISLLSPCFIAILRIPIRAYGLGLTGSPPLPPHCLAAPARPSFTSRCSPSGHCRLPSPLAGLPPFPHRSGSASNVKMTKPPPRIGHPKRLIFSPHFKLFPAAHGLPSIAKRHL